MDLKTRSGKREEPTTREGVKRREKEKEAQCFTHSERRFILKVNW
jgi:hypothetical protein